ncbi:FlxA-like family protein [Paenibacillus sp. HWE-109]|uniref:FlxA-like family protein n=1 Tax=Paenibacillus sp. HWE-109 TaxID=1306526 RepID=UPI001EDCEA0B|nr:FlxA-like family protein [Paenibacillus sp. HWE-109]UKS27568.1 FlxA-like family protein [Paenibacillus sp. HWE-109]
MNINVNSNNSVQAYRPSAPKTDALDTQIKDLMQQTDKLQEQIQNVQANKELNDKQRMVRISEIQEQIQQVEARISQLRLEKLNKQQNEAKEADKNIVSKDDTKMDVILKIGVNFDSIKASNKMNGQLERESKDNLNNVKSDRLYLKLAPAVTDRLNYDIDRVVMTEHAEATTIKSKLEIVKENEAKQAVINNSISKTYAKIKDTIEQIQTEDKKDIGEEDTDKKNEDEVKQVVIKKIEVKQIDIRI